jgi:hypothetical protein
MSLAEIEPFRTRLEFTARGARSALWTAFAFSWALPTECRLSPRGFLPNAITAEPDTAIASAATATSSAGDGRRARFLGVSLQLTPAETRQAPPRG